MTTSVAPQDRQLYDVTVLGDAGWRIVAPHAVYHRQAWTNFGIASISDIHVARRIDDFRRFLIEAGRVEAAQRMFNWNDRFRGFVKYANYLHDIGVLDVILAIGDVIDYIFEDDDDLAGGGNNEFMRKLILGQAPGPDFPSVEELRVPIFMVPGNHDYRKHPYKLLFDVQFRTRVSDHDSIASRISSHTTSCTTMPSPWPMRWRGVLLTPTSKTSLAGVGARMVEVDPEVKGFGTFLSDRRSYTVQLGKHRIAMLDSAYDVGVVTDAD